MSENNTDNKFVSKDPLHGVKLADILERLVDEYEWEELGRQINIRCFKNEPSVKSCLKFLRRTPWARNKVEQLYLHLLELHASRNK